VMTTPTTSTPRRISTPTHWRTCELDAAG
jgi:hypothetical protein